MKNKPTPNESAGRSDVMENVDGKAGMERLAFYVKRVIKAPKDVVTNDGLKRVKVNTRKRKRRGRHDGHGAADKC